MPEQIVASSNPALQQNVPPTTAPPAATPQRAEAAAEPARSESTVQISQAAIQQLNSERSASSGVDIPSTLIGEVSGSEVTQTVDAATQAHAQNNAPAPSPSDGESELGTLVDQYA